MTKQNGQIESPLAEAQLVGTLPRVEQNGDAQRRALAQRATQRLRLSPELEIAVAEASHAASVKQT
jgi:hypothetical protein